MISDNMVNQIIYLGFAMNQEEIMNLHIYVLDILYNRFGIYLDTDPNGLYIFKKEN